MAVPINPQPVAHATQMFALEDAATRFAALDPVEAEATIDAFVAGAIAAWRLEDATYWQRVKFRARHIRTMRRNEAILATAEAKSLPIPAKVAGVTDEPA